MVLACVHFSAQFLQLGAICIIINASLSLLSCSWEDERREDVNNSQNAVWLFLDLGLDVTGDDVHVARTGPHRT